jgi:hypothetical protein
MTAILLLLLAGTALASQSEVSSFNVPDRIETCLKPVTNQYNISGRINPFNLRGDFDGDGKPDYAVLVFNRKGERGIAVCRAAAHAPEIIGAGVVLNKLANFDFDAWMVFEKGPVQRGVGEGPPPKLQGDGISIIWSESASAILYWEGTRFRWYQQGD